MLQALISMPESRRLSLEAKLRHINARKIEQREYRRDNALRDSYDAVAQALADSREALTEQVLTSRIPIVLFEIGLEFCWLSREEAEESSFHWSGPMDYRNPPPIEDPQASIGSHIVQDAFKAWFIATLAGRIEYWRGFALTQDVMPNVSDEDPAATLGSRKVGRQKQLIAAQTRWLPIAKRTIPFAWIHKAAKVDHKDAYEWKSGKLHERSAMSKSIERILRQPNPPRGPVIE